MAESMIPKEADRYREENSSLLMAVDMILEAVADRYPLYDILAFAGADNNHPAIFAHIQEEDMALLDGRLEAVEDTGDTARHLIPDMVSASFLLAIPFDWARDDAYIHQPAVSRRAKVRGHAESLDNVPRQGSPSCNHAFPAGKIAVYRLPAISPAVSWVQT